MNAVAVNLRYLIWATKQQTHDKKTYKEFIDSQASRCHITSERFRGIVAGEVSPTRDEIENIKEYYSRYDEERIPYIDSVFLFQPEIEYYKTELIRENILYLLNSIPWGDNQLFINKLGIRASTLTRWKNRQMNPSRYYQGEICKYFGVAAPEDMKNAFLFLGLSPATIGEKKEKLKRLIDGIDREKLELVYPALEKLLQ